jgi:hypothetical protein
MKKYNQIINNDLFFTRLLKLKIDFIDIEMIIKSKKFDDIMIFSEFTPLEIRYFYLSNKKYER